MKPMKFLGLFTIVLMTGGCSNTSFNPSSFKIYEPGTQFGNRYGSSAWLETPCRKRGCDNNKLFFNPAQPESTMENTHHGF